EQKAKQQASEFMKLIMSMPEEKRISAVRKLAPLVARNEDRRLHYLERHCPSYMDVQLPENGTYRVEVIDVWEMSRTTALPAACGSARIRLPGKEGMAVLATRLSGEAL
ncbi:MAG: DUF5605 domain-containing protein, partial [Clostridiales bacterium]|nr:DUF5605 domain-containing protein [Clostridiales bacterium]